MGMETIGEILGTSRETDRPGPSTGSTERSAWTREARKCEVCGKTHIVAVKVATGEPASKKCALCLEKERWAENKKRAEADLPQVIEETRDRWWEQCGLGGKYLEKTFANFDRKLQPKAFDACKNYDGRSIVLSSPDLYGVGKTHLASALVLQLLENKEAAKVTTDGRYYKHPCPVFITTETRLLASIRATYNRDREDRTAKSEEDVYNDLARFPLLIIDDVGKVRPKDYSFLQGVYFRIIDDRYCNEEPIILTTNLSFAELEEHIGGACADRIREMAGENLIKMAGKSYRSGTKPLAK